MASLARVGSWGLDYLDLRHLKPNREFLSRAEEETDRICEFLETRCFHDAPWAGVQVLKVVKLQEKSLPPKYALELLTVYAWEQGSGQTVFNTAEGFRTVLWLIEHYKEIRIYWTKYYDFHNETIKQYLQVQLCKNRPVILDPADPTANFGEAEGWIRLAEKAKSYASMKCCQKRDGSLVEPWNVPLAKEVPWEEGGSYCTL